MHNKVNTPNIDLHCHLDGSLSLEFLQDILGERITAKDIQVEAECQSLTEYLEKFELPLKCLQTEEHLKMAAYDFIKTCALDHICYAEVRFAPLLSTQEGLSVEQVIESVHMGLELGREKYRVESNIIVCAMRHHSYEENLHMLQSARQFLCTGVCAADLAGDESAYPMKAFVPLFVEAKRMQFPFTIHAGECGDANNIVDAVEAGARRIGHGIAMRGNVQIQQYCAERDIGIEMCPISNMQTKASDECTYPMREFLDAGLKVTINTDNRTVSNSSISKEIWYATSKLGIPEEDIRCMQKNAIDVSFADDSIKNSLYRKFGFL